MELAEWPYKISFPTSKQIEKVVAKRHSEIKKNLVYFLSSFRELQGAWVKVLDKSTKENTAGWNSMVTVEVISSVDENYYKPGAVHTVNATNLYEDRNHASLEYKLAKGK